MPETVTIQEDKPSPESREKLVIDKIYQFTHPDFHATYFPHETNIKGYRELRGLWEQKIKDIAGNPRAMLFYVTAFSVEDFQEVATKKHFEQTARERIILHDRDRIVRTKEKLGKRFILLLPDKNEKSAPFEKEHRRLEHLLDGRGLEIVDSERLTIQCFGEYLEGCVPEEAAYLGQLLGVPLEISRSDSGRYIEPIRHLSLSVQDVTQWRSES